MWAHLGAMLAHLGTMLAQLGAMLAHLGAMLAHLGAMLAHLEAYVGPAWGLCWPMLTHLRPLAPGKAAKMRRAQNTVKRGGFWPYRLSCGRGRGPSLLRRGEKRLRLCHGQGAPGRIKGCRPPPPTPEKNLGSRQLLEFRRRRWFLRWETRKHPENVKFIFIPYKS